MNLSIVTIHPRFFERTVLVLNIRPLISTWSAENVVTLKDEWKPDIY